MSLQTKAIVTALLKQLLSILVITPTGSSRGSLLVVLDATGRQRLHPSNVRGVNVCSITKGISPILYQDQGWLMKARLCSTVTVLWMSIREQLVVLRWKWFGFHGLPHTRAQSFCFSMDLKRGLILYKGCSGEWRRKAMHSCLDRRWDEVNADLFHKKTSNLTRKFEVTVWVFSMPN